MSPAPPTPFPPLPDVVPIEKIRETPHSLLYRAHQVRLGREVLLKVRPIAEAAGSPEATAPAGAPRKKASSDDELARAREEMVLLSRLHSDGIAAALNVSEQAGWLYQIVELPPGKPLTLLFQERGRQPWRPAEVLAMAEEILPAIDHAHKCGVILGRLHPEDIFLSPEGRPKIASLEWATGPGKGKSLPVDQSWIAPEVVGGRLAAPAADLYALGLLLAWLLSGREPSASGLRHASEKALEALRAQGIPDAAADLVGRLLDPAPERRPASAGEALEEVRRIRKILERSRIPRGLLAAAAIAAVLAVSSLLIWLPATSKRAGDGAKPDGVKPIASAPSGEPGIPHPGPEPGKGAPAGIEKPADPSEGKGPPEKAPEGTEKAAADRALEERLEAISKAWRNDPEGWARAEADLRPLLAAQTPAWARKQAEKLLEEVQTDRRGKGRSAVELFRDRDLPRAISEKGFAAAAGALDQLALRFPESAEAIAAIRSELKARQSEALEGLREEVEALLAAGKVDAAERLAKDSAARCTAPEGPAALAALAARIDAVRKERAAAAQLVARKVAAAREHLESNRFDEALSALEVQGIPEDLKAPLAEAWREVGLARSVKNSVEAALDRTILAKSPLRAAVPDMSLEPTGEPETIILDLRAGSELAAHRKGSTVQIRFPWYDLDPSVLEALSAPPDPALFREGLLVILLAARRIEPAARLLKNPAIPEPRRAQYGPRVEDLRSRRLGELAAELTARRRDLSARKGSPEAWASLRDAAAKLVSRHGLEPYFARHRSEIDENFLEAARAVLRSRAPENLFGGRLSREGRDGTVRISYEFREAAEARDWIPLGPGSSFERTGDALLLTGAVRLHRGNPFTGKMKVAVGFPEKGTPQAPIIGVVLGAKESPGAGAGRAFAFVLGFQGSDEKGLEGVLKVPSDPEPLQVQLPANAIFACTGLFPQSKEAIWASPGGKLPGPSAGRLDILVQAGGGQLIWTANGKQLISEKGDPLRKRFSRLGLPDSLEGIAGSAAVFVGSGTALLDTVEVTGLLREQWVEERLEAMARRELEKAYPPIQPAAKSEKK